MRLVFRVVLCVGLACWPTVGRANDVPACKGTCDGSTLQVTYNGGGPLQTWLGANLMCVSPNGQNEPTPCPWCLEIDVWVFNRFTGRWMCAGPYFVPPGPSAQNTTYNQTCESYTTKVFQPTWGTPLGVGLYKITAGVWKGACGSGGQNVSSNEMQILVKGGGTP